MKTSTRKVSYQGQKGMVAVTITVSRGVRHTTEVTAEDGITLHKTIAVSDNNFAVSLDGKLIASYPTIDVLNDIPYHQKLRAAGIYAILSNKVGFTKDQYDLVMSAYNEAVEEARDPELDELNAHRERALEAELAHEDHVRSIEGIE